MPPENDQVTNAITQPLGNSPEARNPDGSLKENAAPVPKAEPPKAETKPEPTTGETKSTPPSSETKPSLLNQKDDEKKPTDEKKPDEKAPEKPESIATGAPEKYEFKALPEGFEVTEKATTFFKDNQMSQMQADNAIKFYYELAKEAQEAPFKYWENMNNDWVKAVETDPEYKGDIKNVRANISKFVDGIGDKAIADSFREAMDLTGAGNNPAFVKFMYRMAVAFNEGTPVNPNNPSLFGQLAPGKSARPDGAHALYPNLK